MKKKALALVAASALLAVGIVAGSLAWLSDETVPVTNVFTPSDINITLEETPNLDLKMVPGWDITKDPKVTVESGSEDCYLFVKVDKSANYGTYLEDYVMADGWTALPGVDGVYYREVAKTNADQEFPVLKDNTVTVKGTVTKADMETAKTDAPTLTVTAYATQLYQKAGEKFPVAAAWENAQPTTAP